METKIINEFELNVLFQKDEIPDLKNEIIYICLISDLLIFQEQVKKKSRLKTIDQLLEKYFLIESSFIEIGKIFIAELDKNQLEDSLFINDEDLIFSPEACNAKIDPILSLKKLLLTPSDSNDWWIYDS